MFSDKITNDIKLDWTLYKMSFQCFFIYKIIFKK